MDKTDILNELEAIHGTSNPQDIPESDRWILYEQLKSEMGFTKPEQYTKQIIIISEALEL